MSSVGSNSKLLVTGFQPFLNEPINPSELLIKALALECPQTIETLLLPVSYENSVAVLKERWTSAGPYRGLLMLGQAAGRKAMCLERVALNWSETSYADEDGVRLAAGPLVEGAASARISEFFPNSWKELLNAEGPTDISFSAGTYVCNSLYYHALNSITVGTPTLFVHVPYLPEQTVTKPDQPSLPFDVQKRVLKRLISLMDQTL